MPPPKQPMAIISIKRPLTQRAPPADQGGQLAYLRWQATTNMRKKFEELVRTPRSCLGGKRGFSHQKLTGWDLNSRGQCSRVLKELYRLETPRKGQPIPLGAHTFQGRQRSSGALRVQCCMHVAVFHNLYSSVTVKAPLWIF